MDFCYFPLFCFLVFHLFCCFLAQHHSLVFTDVRHVNVRHTSCYTIKQFNTSLVSPHVTVPDFKSVRVSVVKIICYKQLTYKLKKCLKFLLFLSSFLFSFFFLSFFSRPIVQYACKQLAESLTKTQSAQAKTACGKPSELFAKFNGSRSLSFKIDRLFLHLTNLRVTLGW